MKWIYSEGGPLLLVERRLLSEWNGSDTSQPEDRPTDYDRACAIVEYMGVIEVANGSAFVLGDEPLQTAIWKDSRDEFTLVRWSYAESEAAFVEVFGQFPNEPQWDPEIVEFNIEDGELVIFDSAFSGREVLESLEIEVNPGLYRARLMLWEPNDKTSLVVHEFRRS